MGKRRANGEGCTYRRPNGTLAAKLTVGYDENGRRKRREVYGRTQREVVEKVARLR